MFQSFSIELQQHLIFSVFESLAWLICTGTQPFRFGHHLILLRCQHKPHFCPCPFIEKKYFLCFVLTLIFICLLWFVHVHTKFLSLSFHRKKLSLLIFYGNTSFKFVNCDLCQHTSFLSLSFHRKKLSLVICANTSWTLLILICANTHLIFVLVLT